MEELDKISIAYPESAKANFIALARGGLTTDYQFLSCYTDYAAQEYLLGNGPATITVAYDHMADVRSYGLYSQGHTAGEFGDEPLMAEGEYLAALQEALAQVESLLVGLVEGRESVVFLAPMGSHGAIAIEAWQVVAQWDLQKDDDSNVHAVRYGTLEGDPEHTQTLANLKSRVTTAATQDAFTGKRIANVSGLTQHYRDIGAYGDITPDDGSTDTFTPAQPPPPLKCASGTAVAEPGTDRALVHDCESLLAAKDTLAGTASLNWATSTAIGSWTGVTAGGDPSRVQTLRLSSSSLTGSIPSQLGRLSDLTALDLSGNKLTGEIPKELGLLYALTELRLSGNQLTGCIPVPLKDVATNDLASLSLPYCEPPPAPENLETGTPGEVSVRLTWDGVSGATTYRVEHRLDGGEWTLDSESITTASHTATGLACASAHEFRVSAFGDGTVYLTLWGEPSSSVMATTTACVPPVFGASNYNFTTGEDSSLGTAVGTVSASDSPHDTLTYAITSGNEESKFAIDASTGVIAVAGLLDFEATSSYRLTVTSTDSNGATDTSAVNVILTPSECSNGVAVPNPKANPGLVRDCSILLASMDALRGTAALDWSSSKAIVTWQGVKVDGWSQRVTALLLTEMGLNGVIPGTLGGLDRLQRIDLDVNALTGEIPSELGRLSRLTNLYLFENKLSGPIPAELGRLTNLVELDLSYNQLSGEIPSELGNLSSLRLLVLDVNQLSGPIPDELGGMDSLEDLWIRWNGLSGSIPSSLGELSIDRLYLGGNDFSGCIPAALKDVGEHDLDLLNLPYCAVSR